MEEIVKKYIKTIVLTPEMAREHTFVSTYNDDAIVIKPWIQGKPEHDKPYKPTERMFPKVTKGVLAPEPIPNT